MADDKGGWLEQDPGQDIWVKAKILPPTDHTPFPTVAFYDRNGDDVGELYYPHPITLIWQPYSEVV